MSKKLQLNMRTYYCCTITLERFIRQTLLSKYLINCERLCLTSVTRAKPNEKMDFPAYFPKRYKLNWCLPA